MAIQASCPACGKAHVVEDQFAGEKLACDECDQLMRIPDPFRMQGKSAKVAQKKKRKQPEPDHTEEVAYVFEVYGLPVSIAIALFCQVMLGLSAVYLAYQNFRAGNALFGAFTLLRLVWIGIIAREIRSGSRMGRWFSIALSIIGIGWSIFLLAGVVALVQTDQTIGGQPMVIDFLLFVIGCQFVLWATNLIALLTMSASRYCNRMGIV